MEGKGEAGEGAWESGLLGEGRREHGRGLGRRGVSRGMEKGGAGERSCSPSPPTAPCLHRVSESHRGLPGKLDCFRFAGFTVLLNESSLLPLPLTCEARLSVTHFAGDHHLFHSQEGMSCGGTWCSSPADMPRAVGTGSGSAQRISLRALSFELFRVQICKINNGHRGDFPLFLSRQAMSHPVAMPEKRAPRQSSCPGKLAPGMMVWGELLR